MENLTNAVASLGYWTWFITALLLSVLELAVPGIHFLWFGVAAFLVGILTAIFGFAWQWQVVAFALLAVGTVYAVTKLTNDESDGADAPALNKRERQYVGRTVVVATDIVDGRGKVRVGDTLWTAQGPDLPAGTTVKVVDTDGTVLIVEAV